MSYESRAYDNGHGDPVVVLVVTGHHDVSRFVNWTNGRFPTVEIMQAGEKILRQVKSHNGGQAALRLLREHGGPDFTGMPGRLDDQGRAALTAVAIGYTNELAARSWGISRSWVGTALHRARLALDARSTAHAVGLALLNDEIDPSQVRDRILPPWPRKYGEDVTS